MPPAVVPPAEVVHHAVVFHPTVHPAVVHQAVAPPPIPHGVGGVLGCNGFTLIFSHTPPTDVQSALERHFCNPFEHIPKQGVPPQVALFCSGVVQVVPNVCPFAHRYEHVVAHPQAVVDQAVVHPAVVAGGNPLVVHQAVVHPPVGVGTGVVGPPAVGYCGQPLVGPHAVVHPAVGILPLVPPHACVHDCNCTKLLANAMVSQNSPLGHCAVSVHFMTV